MLKQSRETAVAFLAVVSLVLLLYGVTASRTVYWGDSGEWLAVTTGLGVAHPWGAPAYTLLGHLFSELPSALGPWRVHLLASAAGAVVAGLLFLFGRLLQLPAGAAAAFALLWATGTVMWTTSGVAEVYSLFLLFWFGSYVSAWSWIQTRSRGMLAASAAAAGLAVSVHAFGFLLLPAWMVLVCLGRPQRREWPALTALLGGGLLFAYIPWSAARNPSVNWGEPSNLTALVEYFSQADFQSAMTAVRAPWQQAPFREWLGFASTDLAWLPLLCIPLAFARPHRRLAACFAGAIILNQAVLSFYDTPEIDALSLPSTLSLAALAMIGAATGLQRVAAHRRRIAGVVLAGVLAGLVVVRFPANYSACNLAASDGSRRMAEALEEALPPRAIFVTGNSTHYFFMLYLQTVEERRKDVTPVFSALLHRPWYRDQIRRAGVVLPAEGGETWDAELQRLNRGRPIAYSPLVGSLSAELVPVGPIYLRATEQRDRARSESLHRRLMESFEGAATQDPGTRAHLAKVHFQLGVFHQLRREAAAAGEAFERTLELHSEDAPAHLNLSTIHRAAGRLEDADRHARRAAALAPGWPAALYNAGLIAADRGDAERARSAWGEYLRVASRFESEERFVGEVRARLASLDARPGGS